MKYNEVQNSSDDATHVNDLNSAFDSPEVMRTQYSWCISCLSCLRQLLRMGGFQRDHTRRDHERDWLDCYGNWENTVGCWLSSPSRGPLLNSLADIDTDSLDPLHSLRNMALPVRPCQVPLMIVEGFFSSVGAFVWGNIHEHSNHLFRAAGQEDRKVIFSK